LFLWPLAAFGYSFVMLLVAVSEIGGISNLREVFKIMFLSMSRTGGKKVEKNLCVTQVLI
jgi:hypothetical protein